jgi:hypothetical protein
LTGVAAEIPLHKEKGPGSNCQSSESVCQATGSYNETKSASVDANSMPAPRGMVLPFVPLSLTFDSIRYSVDVPQVSFRANNYNFLTIFILYFSRTLSK